MGHWGNYMATLWDIKHVPGPRHEHPDLLQQALPVADVQVGAPLSDLGVDVHVHGLQLAVGLPLEHHLYVDGHRGVDTVTAVHWKPESSEWGG